MSGIGSTGKNGQLLSEDTVFRLRTHLNTIVLSSHVLGQDDVSREHLNDNLKAIEESCEAVRQIIAEIRQRKVR